MGLQENSLLAALAGIGVSVTGYILHQWAKRFDPEQQRLTKTEEQQAEEKTWQRARELMDSYAKDKAKSDEKILRLETRLDEEIGKRAALETQLRSEIEKRVEYEKRISHLEEQIKTKDSQIADLNRQIQAQNRPRKAGGLPG